MMFLHSYAYWSRSQIALVVRELDNGVKVEEVCRKLGVTEATVYNWKRKFAGMPTPEVLRLKELEEVENGRLRRLVANLSLEKSMLQDIVSKKI